MTDWDRWGHVESEELVMQCEIGPNRIVCRKRESPRCYSCGKPSTKLCDFPTGAGLGTCDAQICDRCAVRVAPNTDYCPKHQDRMMGK